MALRDITEWASDEIRTIDVMSDVSPVPLQLKVRRFIPDARDSTYRGWMDGKIKRWTKTTPWAIVNMPAAMEDMRVYITNNIFSSVDFFLAESDEWVVETYKYARKHMIKVQVSVFSQCALWTPYSVDIQGHMLMMNSPKKRESCSATSSGSGSPFVAPPPWSTSLARRPLTWATMPSLDRPTAPRSRCHQS
jgi:hypothetical protein